MTPVWNELSGGDSVGPGGGFSGSESGWTRINAASSGMGGPSDNGIEDGSNGNGSGAGRGGGGEGGPDGDGGDDDRATKDKAKKANPLVDLIETETAYVSELGKIIKKVAGAWSRSNFPPPELDTMFRNVESIYRVNRSFLRSLKEIGPNPSSPRALGDLLMRWIDDLETPYTRYCENYFTDFDTWATVQSNAKLPPLLQQISESEDGLPIVYSDKKRQAGSVWTLDQLFALPQTRLKYYKKLYARLLKSTQPGRSDHRLLVAANEKLDELLELSKRRIATSILDDGSILRSSTRASAESSAGDTSNTLDSAPAQRASSATSAASGEAHHTPQPTIKDGSPPFQATVQAPTPLVKVPEPSPNGRLPSSHDSALEPTDNLEYRLDTARTLDIFSMQPKVSVASLFP
ncbi:hypothetical protein L7F22_061658 [Adiantum nelumboides]|nr:hypothetical protein [Adiantum nelumboides]